MKRSDSGMQPSATRWPTSGRHVSGLVLQRDSEQRVVHVGGGLAAELAMPVTLSHVRRMADGTGILEHAEGAVPRREHGYCTDDVARQLLIAALHPEDPCAQQLAEEAMAFLRHAEMPDGRFRSRMNYARVWMDEGNSDDASGRALWALGSAAGEAPWMHVRDAAANQFSRMCTFRSGHWHSMAFAALGATAMLNVSPEHRGALGLASAAAGMLPRPRPGTPARGIGWLWPEDRITYASALLPDALLALSGIAGLDDALLDDGLDLLHWLDRLVCAGRHLTPVPVAGLAAGDVRPGFDQQPIEAQAIASAAWRAWGLTGDPVWLETVVRAASWFVGANDASVALIDRVTHGCGDGLVPGGRSANQGAESTLAMLHTMAILRQAVAEGSVVLEPPARDRSESGGIAERSDGGVHRVLHGNRPTAAPPTNS